ncbi:hypothetical protein ACVWXM_005814 [Bradyrhizobium sp. GM7.3]
MRNVAIECGEIGVPVHHVEQVGAHLDEIAGAAGCAVEAADQLLPARLGGEVQGAGILVGRLGAPCLDRLGQAFPIRAEIAHQGFEKGATSRRIQVLVDVEHLTRHGGCRKLHPGPTAARHRARSAHRRPAWCRQNPRGEAACGRARRW